MDEMTLRKMPDRHGSDRIAPVPALIYDRMRAQPNAIAISGGHREFTYRQLQNLTNEIRQRLWLAGVRKNDVVALLMGPSPEFVAAALAVLSVGAAYLPIAKNCPAERILMMMADSGTRCLISTSGTGDEIHIPPDVFHIKLDQGLAWPTTEDVSSVYVEAEPGSLAYLIYTSGSTGIPKGVEISHRSLSYLVDWHNRAFSITQEDRTSQIASLSFDAAVWEIWPCLVAGATLCIAEDAERKDANRLRKWLQNERITVAFVPTVLAEELMAMTWRQTAALRLLLTGGEALRAYPPRNLPFTLVNNYGLTECTVVSTSAPVRPNHTSSTRPPIGFPIDYAEVHILRQDLTPVAPGETGEIYIGGSSLALRYRNRADLTAEKFIPNPFDKTPGARLFRTGDLGKILDDGQIQFAGRLDNQVKIRGFRIELAEVEAAIVRHPAVGQCAVTTRGEGIEKQIIAYVVPAGVKFGIDEVRRFVGNALPDYMIPSDFVLLDRLPTNLNGKVDFAALPVPSRALAGLEDKVAPRTEIERQIASIVGGLLKVDEIGVEDNLFLLGGHSLFAAQLIARLREQFHLEVQLLSVFESPTIANLAALIKDGVTARSARAAG